MLARKLSQNVLYRRFSILSKHPDVAKALNLTDNEKGVYFGKWTKGNGAENTQYDPSTNESLGKVSFGNKTDYEQVVKAMDGAHNEWANLPAPKRGEIVRQLGDKLREKKEPLGKIISIEMGKIYAEGLGEVQEAIDICDYAVGLSRQLNGSIIPSERPDHVMMERWNPLKHHVGIISAFNFPVAVYFWNLALSMVCGNTNLWKPHENLSLTSVATTKLIAEVLERNQLNGAIASMICGSGKEVGEALIQDPRMEVVSFTGSTQVGRHVAKVVSGRFGRHILELGGNAAMIVDESANLGLALTATLFGAVGTAGQRCTTQRRLLLHEKVYDAVLAKLLLAYKSVRIGAPLDPATLCGPLHTKQAVEIYKNTIKEAVAQGGKILTGGRVLTDRPGNFVEPTVIDIPAGATVTQHEAFVPILYVMKIKSFEEGVRINNAVPQGLSSCLFSENLDNIFKWMGPSGSDCGIVNVNIGTSGAEIGGAFGGNKETGHGRESGSDSWKAYMTRSTCTLNHSKKLPLAQGISFEV